MTVYFVTFISSFFVCALGERMYACNRKNISAGFMFLAVLIPAILAGIRDYTVGTDVATYGHWLFSSALNANSLKWFMISNKSIDILYSAFVYFVAWFFKSEHWLYFFSGLITYLFVMLTLCHYRKYMNVSFAWLSYLFLFYGDSLNAMRQCMAVAIAFWGFHFFQEHKWKAGIIITVIACLFHNTAIVTFGIAIVYYLIEKKDTRIFKFWILFVTTLIFISYSKLINLGVGIGILNDKFLRYELANQVVFSFNPILIRLPYIFIIWLFYHNFSGKNRSDEQLSSFMILMILMEMLSAELRIVHPTLYRVSLYFGVYRCLGLGRVVGSLKISNRRIVSAVLLLLFVVTWIYQNVVQGNNEIYPFTSQLIGI